MFQKMGDKSNQNLGLYLILGRIGSCQYIFAKMKGKWLLLDPHLSLCWVSLDKERNMYHIWISYVILFTNYS